jgi:hypothetical protein
MLGRRPKNSPRKPVKPKAKPIAKADSEAGEKSDD